MAELMTLPTFTDARGSLTVLEKVLPFEIKRVYWIYDVKLQVRGGHRHKQTHQAFVCVNGSVDIYIQNKKKVKTISLNDPNQCLLVPPNDWHTMNNFSEKAVLLVLASHVYDPSDYIEEPLIHT